MIRRLAIIGCLAIAAIAISQLASHPTPIKGGAATGMASGGAPESMTALIVFCLIGSGLAAMGLNKYMGRNESINKHEPAMPVERGSVQNELLHRIRKAEACIGNDRELKIELILAKEKYEAGLFMICRNYVEDLESKLYGKKER